MLIMCFRYTTKRKEGRQWGLIWMCRAGSSSDDDDDDEGMTIKCNFTTLLLFPFSSQCRSKCRFRAQRKKRQTINSRRRLVEKQQQRAQDVTKKKESEGRKPHIEINRKLLFHVDVDSLFVGIKCVTRMNFYGIKIKFPIHWANEPPKKCKYTPARPRAAQEENSIWGKQVRGGGGGSTQQKDNFNFEANQKNRQSSSSMLSSSMLRKQKPRLGAKKREQLRIEWKKTSTKREMKIQLPSQVEDEKFPSSASESPRHSCVSAFLRHETEKQIVWWWWC